ncbi:hypothetical protein C8J57DRAFT_1482133 [Mycena rebaudengoi]|nr:hypothetical protein C8J57DRAFT_1482133 [Mycena rebaudengoi]
MRMVWGARMQRARKRGMEEVRRKRIDNKERENNWRNWKTKMKDNEKTRERVGRRRVHWQGVAGRGVVRRGRGVRGIGKEKRHGVQQSQVRGRRGGETKGVCCCLGGGSWADSAKTPRQCTALAKRCIRGPLTLHPRVRATHPRELCWRCAEEPVERERGDDQPKALAL